MIEGVDFQYLLSIDLKGNKKTSHQNMDNLDPRMLVFLWKLCRMLKIDHSANVIYHIGFAFGPERNDCHGQGRALDFAGAAGDKFDVTVGHDWSNQPVTLLNDYTDPKSRKVIPAGTKLDQWPTAPFRDVYYRLDPSLNPNLDPDAGNSSSRSTLLRGLRDGRRRVLGHEHDRRFPDRDRRQELVLHPPPRLSQQPARHPARCEAHWQHIHMQIGPTGTDNNPP